jgi:zinc-ribbon domain
MLNKPVQGADTRDDKGRTETSATGTKLPELGVTTLSGAKIKCPKCGSEARDVARFCSRCHMTLRYFCPACKHEQRHGQKCDMCGVDFAKYVFAIMSTKRVAGDALRDRMDRRTNFVTQAILAPLTCGLSLLKYLFREAGDD